MNGKETNQIDLLSDRMGKVEIDIYEIKTNHLPHIARDAEKAKFRAGATIIGVTFLGLMIVVLGIMVTMN